MADESSNFKRIHIQRSRPSSEKQIYNIKVIDLTIPVLKYTCDKNLPELLNEGPKPIQEIASLLQVQAEYLHRLLRALSTIGYYSYNPQSKIWSNSRSSAMLQGDIKKMFNHFVNPKARFVKRFLPQVLEQDKTAYEISCLPTVDFCSQEFIDRFHIFMEAATRVAMRNLAVYLKLSGYNSAIDIGGGTGTLLEYIHAESPNMRLANFEVPELKTKSIQQLKAAGLDNVEFIGGNFFESVPSGFDVYILKHIIHDWNDEKCSIILRNIRRAINQTGLLLIIDNIISNQDYTGRLTKLDDVRMMALLNAESRTERQFTNLLKKNGFKLKNIKYNSEDLSLIYCIPD